MMKRKTIRVILNGGKKDGHEIMCFDWPLGVIKYFGGEEYLRVGINDHLGILSALCMGDVLPCIE